MTRMIRILLCASVLAGCLSCSSSAEFDGAMVFDSGLLVVNTSTATWSFSADGDERNLVDILEGDLEERLFKDDTGNLWPYQVAIFKRNGSLVFGEDLRVSFVGQGAVSISSTHGSIEVYSWFILDGHINAESASGSLGGYGETRGPGGGGFSNHPFLPSKPPGGAGHGGLGGEAFKITTGRPDPSTGDFVYRDELYGYPYLIGDTYHLIGGSAGGKVEYDPSVLVFPNARGGGAIEITARDNITIGSYISANGESGMLYDAAFVSRFTVEPCGGGGSGGLIRLKASEIEFLQSGYLSVSGGNGAQDKDTGVYCGGGGAGGIIALHISDRLHGFLHGTHLVLDAGIGTQNGWQGLLDISTYPDNVRCEATVPPLPSNESLPSTRPTHTEPSMPCTLTDPVPCDCEKATSSAPDCDCTEPVHCPTSSNTTECDCREAGYQTSPQMTEVTKPSFPEIIVKELEESLIVIEGMGDYYTKKGAVELLMAVESTGLKFGKKLAEGSQTSERISIATETQTIGMQVVVIDNASALQGYIFPDPLDPVFDLDWWRETSVLVKVSTSFPDYAQGNVIIVNVLYTNISKSLHNVSETDGVIESVNSRLLGTNVYLTDNTTTNFNISICFTADKLQKKVSGMSACVFWDLQAGEPGAWSTRGCRLLSENASHAVCICDHLSNFAILLMPDRVKLTSKDEFVLGVLSKFALSLSLCALLLAFVAIGVSLKSLKDFSAAVIHLNLIASLAIADLLFLIGVDRTEDEVWCRGVTITLHYFYMATFMWMLCEGCHIYIRVSHPFTSVKGHLKFYFLASWGIPAVIVGVTAGVRSEGYGGQLACWLDTATHIVRSFIGPVAVILLINTVFLALILYRFLTVKSISKKCKYQRLKRASGACFVLLPLLGTAWAFGLLAFGTGSLALFYVSVALHSLQGVLICIFHCLANEEVTSTLRVKLRGSRTRIDVMMTSAMVTIQINATTQ